MNFPFYIARRYLISKKSHNIINIISAISVTGVCIGTMALIIVLSVFNGFEKLVLSLFSSFNPDVRIIAARGKTFDIRSLPLEEIRKIPGVVHLSEVIEEDALVRYRDKQTIVTLKGVEKTFPQMTRIDTMMIEGKFLLEDSTMNFGVPGYGIASTLGVNLQDYQNPLVIYVPRRDGSFSTSLDNAFNSGVVFASGFFSIQQDYDVKYLLLPLRFVKELLDYKEDRSALEIGLQPGADQEKICQSLTRIAGNRFIVQNRYQQQATLYKILSSEKLYIFLILTFILFMATFNVIGSLSMLILDKRKDIAVLRSIGCTTARIKRIFFTEGILISMIGAAVGLVLGAVICWIQIRYGLISLGAPDSSFVVSAYPVDLKAIDFLVVFATVLTIGGLAAWYPVHNIRKIDFGSIKLD